MFGDHSRNSIMRGKMQTSKAGDKKSMKSKLKGQPPLLGSPAPTGSKTAGAD